MGGDSVAVVHGQLSGAARQAACSAGPGLPFRVGWWLLVVLTALLLANHAVGSLAFANSEDERALFLIFLALGVLSLVVLLIPYRRRERWSWWAIWIPVVANVLPLVVFGLGSVGGLYAGVAVAMAAGQLLTLRAFGHVDRADVAAG
jgi:hypothetical protein